ncbi:MAG TPA: hypothetical protein PKW45_15545 [Bryobacteraceae bacterium]|nr:hypothetical protein [Bryobacteraceae bacterium]
MHRNCLGVCFGKSLEIRPPFADVVVGPEDAVGRTRRGNSAFELVRQRVQQPVDIILRPNEGTPVGPMPDADAAVPPRIG